MLTNTLRLTFGVDYIIKNNLNAQFGGYKI